MTAMGIIGIILAGVMAALLLMGGINALIEKYFEKKCAMTTHIIDYAAEAFSSECQCLYRNIMKDTTEMVPNMMRTCVKTFTEDEEP